MAPTHPTRPQHTCSMGNCKAEACQLSMKNCWSGRNIFSYFRFTSGLHLSAPYTWECVLWQALLPSDCTENVQGLLSAPAASITWEFVRWERLGRPQQDWASGSPCPLSRRAGGLAEGSNPQDLHPLEGSSTPPPSLPTLLLLPAAADVQIDV